MIENLMEIVITLAGFLILILYLAHLVYTVRISPMTTSIGLTNRFRSEWVNVVMQDDQDMLAVQTFKLDRKV